MANDTSNPRDAIRAAREQRRLRVIKSQGGPTTVKVYAANDEIRDLLKHATGVRFREDGSAEWPNDSFTARRIAEGSVRTDGPGTGEPAPVDESLNVREQAEAMKPKPKSGNDEPKFGNGKHAKSQPQPTPPAA
jgi:hypothetical protein